MTNYIPKVGDKVLFGRKSGEQTLGTILRVNDRSVKVRQDEQRGTVKVHPVGTRWKVHPSMVQPAPADRIAEAIEANPESIVPVLVTGPVDKHTKADEPIPEFWGKAGDHGILEAIDDIYGALDPANLSCDGELPKKEVFRKERWLRERLVQLFVLYGRPVSEGAITDWRRKQRKDTNECITTSPANGGHF